MEIRRANSIEQAAGLSCATCTLRDECKNVKLIGDNQGLVICQYYYNPEKGYFNDIGRRKINGKR